MFKELVVYLNDETSREQTLNAAMGFAIDLNADLIGLYTKFVAARDFPNYGYVTPEMVQEAAKHEEERAAKARELFESLTDKSECQATWVELANTDDPLSVINYADLVISNQVSYDERLGRSNMGFVNKLIFASSKPIVLIPTDWRRNSFGRKIMVGWNESRESMRAVQDAMPLLQAADHVDVVCVEYAHQDNANVENISHYLSRHDVTCSVHLAKTDDRFTTPETVLQGYTESLDTDLLVIGGYGHSRIREIILGGVTRYFIKHALVPVFISH